MTETYFECPDGYVYLARPGGEIFHLAVTPPQIKVDDLVWHKAQASFSSLCYRLHYCDRVGVKPTLLIPLRQVCRLCLKQFNEHWYD